MKCRLNLCLVVAVVLILGVGYAATKTPLMEASEKGDTKEVKALLANGADVNAKDNIGLTALMLAAREGRTMSMEEAIGYALEEEPE